MRTAIVQAYRTGARYVDCDGYQYESNDLPPEGTEVTVDPFTAIGDIPGVGVGWPNESSSGCGFARIIGGRVSSSVDPGWECDRCGHMNDDTDEECAGTDCVKFREWATERPQED